MSGTQFMIYCARLALADRFFVALSLFDSFWIDGRQLQVWCYNKSGMIIALL
jgi:hypothetical protein